MSQQFSTRQLPESLGYELKMLSGTDVPYAIVDSPLIPLELIATHFPCIATHRMLH